MYSLIKHWCAKAQKKFNAFSSNSCISIRALAASSIVKRVAVRNRSSSMSQIVVDSSRHRSNRSLQTSANSECVESECDAVAVG